LGGEVAVLVNEKKAQGSYEIKSNAARLVSGMYLYRLTAGGFVQTRKLIVIEQNHPYLKDSSTRFLFDEICDIFVDFLPSDVYTHAKPTKVRFWETCPSQTWKRTCFLPPFALPPLFAGFSPNSEYPRHLLMLS
jgi:hypothetical protein